ASIDPANAAFIALLVDILNNASLIDLRLAAATALKRAGKAAKPAIPALVGIIRSRNRQDPNIRTLLLGKVASTLGELATESKDIEPSLLELLVDSALPDQVRLLSIHALENFPR